MQTNAIFINNQLFLKDEFIETKKFRKKTKQYIPYYTNMNSRKTNTMKIFTKIYKKKPK